MRDKKLTVYLAGGHKSGWQNRVKQHFKGICFLDPSTHNLKNPREYTAWDLALIRRADIVFAYLELSNPSGYGMALEIGYAKALQKMIILVNEKTSYTDMIESMCDVVYKNLENGITYLKQLETHMDIS